MKTQARTVWSPTLGAWCSEDGVHFSVWAPAARSVEVLLEETSHRPLPLQRSPDGMFHGVVPGARPGVLYWYRLDGRDSYPDPASRFQPKGVHGPSQVVDLRPFAWSDESWRGVELRNLILYELHVGAFTEAGTFAGVRRKLEYLADLGITALELMPLADFPGNHNWGYDGVSLYAPARCYGSPEDLCQLIDAAHHVGLAVLIDVVYNHLGPDGNVLGSFSPHYFSKRHHTPWGSAINLDGAHTAQVRNFFIENALTWIHDYHADGLRLDATHALRDESDRPFLTELTDRVHASVTDRRVVVIAEDCRNLVQMVQPSTQEGWGLDAVWSDDFHHQVRRSLAGDHEGYYEDFTGRVQDLCTTIGKGWLFCGQPSAYFKGPRGSEPEGTPLERFVFFIQNHDQIGNRAFGDRLNHEINAAAYRAATVLLLTLPETPLLFMGQEWAAQSPFLYFTDHAADLGRQVTEGRRGEFKTFSTFSDPANRAHIPDPQDPTTFQRSRLKWDELNREESAAVHRLYRALLHWRRKELLTIDIQHEDFKVEALNDSCLRLEYWAAGVARILILVQWTGAGRQNLPANEADYWQAVLTTEDPTFCPDPHPVRWESAAVQFQRPGAVILKPKSP